MDERKGWIGELSQSFHVRPASEYVPVSVSRSRILRRKLTLFDFLYFSLATLPFFLAFLVITIPLIQFLLFFFFNMITLICSFSFYLIIYSIGWQAHSSLISCSLLTVIQLRASAVLQYKTVWVFSAGQTVTHHDPTKEKSALSHYLTWIAKTS